MEKIFFKISVTNKSMEAYEESPAGEVKIGSIHIPQLQVYHAPQGQILSHRLIKAVDFEEYLQLSIQKVNPDGTASGDIYHEKIFRIDQLILDRVTTGFLKRTVTEIEELIQNLESGVYSINCESKIKRLRDAKNIILGIGQIYEAPSLTIIDDMIRQIQKFESSHYIPFPDLSKIQLFREDIDVFQQKMDTLFVGDLTGEKKEQVMLHIEDMKSKYPESRVFFEKKESFVKELPLFCIQNTDGAETFSIPLERPEKESSSSQISEENTISKETPPTEISKEEKPPIPIKIFSLKEKKEKVITPSSSRDLSPTSIPEETKEEDVLDKKELPISEQNAWFLEELKEVSFYDLPETNKMVVFVLGEIEKNLLTRDTANNLIELLKEEKVHIEQFLNMKKAKNHYREEREKLEKIQISYSNEGAERAESLLVDCLSYLRENVTNTKAKEAKDYEAAMERIQTAKEEAETLYQEEKKELISSFEEKKEALADGKYDSCEDVSSLREISIQETDYFQEIREKISQIEKGIAQMNLFLTEKESPVLKERIIEEGAEEDPPKEIESTNEEARRLLGNLREKEAVAATVIPLDAVDEEDDSPKEKSLVEEPEEEEVSAESIIGSAPLQERAAEENLPKASFNIPKREIVIVPSGKLEPSKVQEKLEEITDIDRSMPFYPFIGKCMEYRILGPFKDNTFRPADEISITNLLQGIGRILPEVEDFELPIAGVDRSYRGYESLQKAVVFGLVDEKKPFDETMKATRSLTFTLMMKLIKKEPLLLEEAKKILAPFEDAENIPDDEKGYIAKFFLEGKIHGKNGKLHVAVPIKRSEVAVIFGSILKQV